MIAFPKSFQGKVVIQREIEPEDTASLLKWRNHPKIQPFLTLNGEPLTEAQHLKWLQQYYQNPHQHYYVGFFKDTEAFVGTHGICGWDPVRKEIEYGWAFVRPGYEIFAFESTILLLQAAFEYYPCEAIVGYQRPDNVAVLSYVKKLDLKLYRIMALIGLDNILGRY